MSDTGQKLSPVLGDAFGNPLAFLIRPACILYLLQLVSQPGFSVVRSLFRPRFSFKPDNGRVHPGEFRVQMQTLLVVGIISG